MDVYVLTSAFNVIYVPAIVLFSYFSFKIGIFLQMAILV